MKSFIKFNLYLYYAKKKVANLDDLRENFYIDDILDLYKTKELQSWLESRSADNDNEYSKIKSEIEDIDKKKNESIELNSLTDDVLMLKIYMIFFPSANIKNTENEIKIFHDGRKEREKKLKGLNKAEELFKNTINTIIPMYSEIVNKLIKIGGKEFAETYDMINYIGNNYIQLFELQCASIVNELSKNNCYFALLGLLTYDKLRKIVLDKSDKLSELVWKEYHDSVTDFCKLFVKKYHKKNKDYDKYIKVKKINKIFSSDKSVKKIESKGEFLILNIPASCKVKNYYNQTILEGNICKGNLKLLPSKNLNTIIDNDSITRQLHYIKIR